MDALLTQLGYNKDDVSRELIKLVFNSTDGLESKSVIALNDHLKPIGGYVAISGSEPRLKVKLPDDIELKQKCKETLFTWANKYKMNLKEINENTFYILGIKE